MMRKLIMAGIAILTVAISSCDEETTTLGYSLTDSVDKFTIITDTFNVATRSIKADSVLSRSSYSYLGRFKDPETGSYITSDYMTQFSLLENEASQIFPAKEYIQHLDDAGLPVADSCTVGIMVNAFQGDSLTAMKLTLCELDRPVSEKGVYYTDFDPEKKGYLRDAKEADGVTKTGAIFQNKVYSISDLTLSDSLRNIYRSNNYYEYINIKLNGDYTDRDGHTYAGYDSSKGYGSGYGTYLMRAFYAHPEYFKNATTFTSKVCSGFYIKTTGGLGLMTEVARTQLTVYFHYEINGTKYSASRTFNSTEEVLQTTHITNDKASIEALVSDDKCTYLKTPAGIFTEVTLPVDDIKLGHENDTITSAKITFNRMKDVSNLSEVVLEEPTNLLLVERDSLYTFFEQNNLPDNIKSYMATYNSTLKTYSFNNISNLINRMYANRGRSENWNKAVLIPVQTATTTSGSTTTVASIANEMNINSVRLVGGSANEHQPVRISIIYNQNK